MDDVTMGYKFHFKLMPDDGFWWVDVVMKKGEASRY